MHGWASITIMHYRSLYKFLDHLKLVNGHYICKQHPLYSLYNHTVAIILDYVIQKPSMTITECDNVIK